MSKMHVERKRIFIGNLPPSIQENEIKQQFSQYGKIVSIDIKHRQENTNETVSPVFAFVSIEIDNENLYTCFQEISNYNWQGYYVKLELAKESFLERLKREREEEQAKKSGNINSTVPTDVAESIYVSPTITLNTNKKLHSLSSEFVEKVKENVYTEANGAEKESSSSSDSESEEETKSNIILEENDLIIKNNKNKSLTNGKLKIESINSTPIHIITPKQSGFQIKDKVKLTPADEKRLKSLNQMKESYIHQKSTIKNALSKVDVRLSNKIVFDEDGHNLQGRNKKRTHEFQNRAPGSKKEKLSLFAEDGDDENDINFDIRKQFEGKKGEKLLELQSRFTNDKRFTLDSRFTYDENETEEIIPVVNDERQEQFDILESVLGRKIRSAPVDAEIKNKKVSQGMLRFDPSKSEHSKFEIKEKINVQRKRKETKILEEKEQKDDEPAVEVSKEKFYKVTDNLKQSLKENEGFSLLSMFGRAEEKDNEEYQDHPETSEEIKKKKFDANRNPFKYDSSDTEDDEEPDNSNKKVLKNAHKKQDIFRPLCGEKFFFQLNDERLKDGLEFLKKFNTGEKSEIFSETRREIKQIIRAKVRNVQRNNRPFRKQLGRHKHIKIKKAKKL